MTDLSHRAFFGDRERVFAIPPELIVELERKLGSGIGAIYQRLLDRHYQHADLLEIIRLGLIGGGEDAKASAGLVDAYAKPRPISEALAVALPIMDALFFGTAADVGAAPVDQSASEDVAHEQP